MNQAVIGLRTAQAEALHRSDITPPNLTTFKRTWLNVDERFENNELCPKHPLKHFQAEGVYNAGAILRVYSGVIIADDMGLGKTIEAIVLSQYMRAERMLIVVPANTINQWIVQYYKWTGNLLTHIKTKAAAKTFNSTATPLAICSYEMLDSLCVLPHAPWDMIIYDEIHKLRSRNAKMCLAARELRDRTKYVVGLTGTLQWGYTRDLWNPLRCVFRYAFGSADEFDFTYCGAYINEHGGKENKGFKSSDGVDRSAELAIRLSYVSIERSRRDVAAELPVFERKITRIPSTTKATIALHAFLRKELPYMNAIMSTTSEKTPVVLELLESMRNAIVFTWTNADVATLTALIAKTGRGVYTITGSTSKAERTSIITKAAAEKASIVATIDSIGVGVDGLQHVSSNIIFHSLSHSPKLHLQAEARAHRIGQQNPVVIHYIVMQDSADELVISVLNAKSGQDKAKDAAEAGKAFTALAMDDKSMQNVLDEWVKNATNEIDNPDTATHNGWDDNGDDE